MKDELELMHALADGELSGEEEREARRILESSPAAQAEYEWAKACRSAVQAKCSRHDSAECWERAKSQIAEIERSRSIESFVGRYSWALCGFLLCTLLAAGVAHRMGGKPQISDASMAGLFSPENLAPLGREVAQAEIPTLIQDTLGRANESLVSVPEIFRVVEADRALLEGRQALHLLIEDSAGQFSAFLVPGVAGVQGFDQEFSADYQVGVLFDQPCVAWSNGDSLVMITAARSAGELLQTADLLRSAQSLP
jgi:hypothetical protein